MWFVYYHSIFIQVVRIFFSKTFFNKKITFVCFKQKIPRVKSYSSVLNLSYHAYDAYITMLFTHQLQGYVFQQHCSTGCQTYRVFIPKLSCLHYVNYHVVYTEGTGGKKKVSQSSPHALDTEVSCLWCAKLPCYLGRSYRSYRCIFPRVEVNRARGILTYQPCGAKLPCYFRGNYRGMFQHPVKSYRPR